LTTAPISEYIPHMKKNLLILLFMLLIAQFASAQPEKKLNPNMLEEVKRAMSKIPKNRIIKKSPETAPPTENKSGSDE